MLAQPARGVGELLKRFEEAAFTCEYKYDGERAQVRLWGVWGGPWGAAPPHSSPPCVVFPPHPQIHVLESGAVFIYSRNQENTTAKYPDLVDRIPKAGGGELGGFRGAHLMLSTSPPSPPFPFPQVLKPGVRSCILDAEAVAWDRTTRQIQPFQVLMTRKRKVRAGSRDTGRQHPASAVTPPSPSPPQQRVPPHRRTWMPLPSRCRSASTPSTCSTSTGR